MIEKEIKKLLTIQEYKKVLDLFDFKEPYIQTNYYYGYNDNVINDMTIRIREKNDKVVLQVKIPQIIDHSLHIKQEFEREIDKIYDVIDKNILEQMTGIKFKDDLILIGHLVTHRAICDKYDGIEIALDKNEYLGVKDYELEIEYYKEYPQFLLDVLANECIYLNHNVLGKKKRFNNRLLIM